VANFLDVIHHPNFHLKLRFGEWTLPSSSGKETDVVGPYLWSYQRFMEPKVHCGVLQELATDLYPEPEISTPYFSKIYFNIFFPSASRSP
jgi:hypothetical protein